MPSGPAQHITPAQFVAKWQRVNLPERAASQEHYIDLCRMLGQPTPAEHDATGAEYAFEKGVDVASGASKGAKGDRGFADVWWKNKFGWEYKRKGKYNTLDDAYRPLLAPTGPRRVATGEAQPGDSRAERNPWTESNKRNSPAPAGRWNRTAQGLSIKHIPLIELDLVLSEKP